MITALLILYSYQYKQLFIHTPISPQNDFNCCNCIWYTIWFVWLDRGDFTTELTPFIHSLQWTFLFRWSLIGDTNPKTNITAIFFSTSHVFESLYQAATCRLLFILLASLKSCSRPIALNNFSGFIWLP